MHALISDISLSGMCLYLDASLEHNLDVSLTISFISGDGSIKSDTIDGRVVYIRQMEGMHFAGIEFHEEINRKNQPLLYEHMHNILMCDK